MHLQFPGEAPEDEAEIIDVALDLLPPGLQNPDRSLQILHPVITLVVDLSQPDQFESPHPLVQLFQPNFEMGTPVVGDRGGGVLSRHETLQRGESGVDGDLALPEGSLRVIDSLLQAPPALGGTSIVVVHLLQQFLERLGDDRIHGSPCPLESGEVLVGGCRRIQGSPVPRLDGFDTRLLTTSPRRVTIDRRLERSGYKRGTQVPYLVFLHE